MLMRMTVRIRAQIVRMVDPHYPGFVECELVDVDGVRWSIVDKVPVVTLEDLDERSSYPRSVELACTVLERFRSPEGIELALIDIGSPWGLQASDGETTFEVRVDQLREIVQP